MGSRISKSRISASRRRFRSAADRSAASFPGAACSGSRATVPATDRSGPRTCRWKWYTRWRTGRTGRKLRLAGIALPASRPCPPSKAISRKSRGAPNRRRERLALTCGSCVSSRPPRSPGGAIELAQLAFQRLEQPAAAVPERRIVQADIAAHVDSLAVAPGDVADHPVQQRGAAELSPVDARHVGERAGPAGDLPGSQAVVQALEQQTTSPVDGKHPQI